MRIVASFASGLVFGLGLLISGMANPAKVQNFLDLAGTFDPSLILVMLGAVAVTFVGYRFVLARPRPLFAERFALPTLKEIDARLVLGAGVFGIGWGLSGFCPGPAMTSLPLLAKGTLIFVPAMLAGIGLARVVTTTSLSSGETATGQSEA
jgi:uncharacterized membrane protein YedE/YeeE